ncbi:MAG: DNA polymerase III subunit gamma/tau [Phycisphaerales bacterium]|nr:DNA polymerase III subunit gamma/tau [Phycisphaerales bacterium]
MSYTVIARRYRSKTFDEVVGQNHIAQTLKKAITSGRIAHAFLFCGTRGVGKTSMARILAKALNCDKSDGPTPQPCNECASCKAIAKGEDLDVIEIDAASNTGVDDIRDVIDNAQYRPARGRFKIYIIDEVHMLSKNAFNALLKTLEEPPGHVKFILATTEAEKVLPTIQSRCQRYDFRNIPTREIAGHLRDICKQEKIDADEDALLLVAKAGAGSMRDALSLLDRLLSVGENKLTAELIEQLLGLPKGQSIFNLAQAIGEGQIPQVLEGVDAMLAGGLSAEALIAALAEHLRNLLILRTCGPQSNLVELPGLSVEQMNQQAQQFDTIALTQDIAILEELRRLLRQSQAGRSLLEATMVRLALADQFASIADLLSGMNASPAALAAPAQKKNFEPVASPPTPPPTVSETNSSDEADDDSDLPQVGRVWEGPRPSLSTLMARSRTVDPPQSSPPPSNIAPVEPDDSPAIWQALLRQLSEQNPSLIAMLSKGRFAGIDEGQAVIQFAKEQEFFAKNLDRNGKKDLLRDTLGRILGRPIGIKIDITAEAITPSITPTPPPTPTPNAPSPTHPTAATTTQGDPTSLPLTPDRLASIQSDPLIKSLLDNFGGTIIKVIEQ